MRTITPLVLVALLVGCDDGPAPVDAGQAEADSGRVPGVDGGLGSDGGPRDAGPPGVDGGPGDTDAGGGGPGVSSTLTLSCDGELGGRAIVNFNSNLGVAFTDPTSPFTSRGSISFDFPTGFTGPIGNPEIVGDGPRHTLAITDRAFTTYGNHCWPFGSPSQSGSGRIDVWRPSDGVVSATFTDFPLRNCVSMADTCVLNGSIETPGEGVFE